MNYSLPSNSPLVTLYVAAVHVTSKSTNSIQHGTGFSATNVLRG